MQLNPRNLRGCRDCSGLLEPPLNVYPHCVWFWGRECELELCIWRVKTCYSICRTVTEEQEGEYHWQMVPRSVTSDLSFLNATGGSVSPLPVSVLRMSAWQKSVDQGWRKCLTGPASLHTHVLTSSKTAWDSFYWPDGKHLIKDEAIEMDDLGLLFS